LASGFTRKLLFLIVVVACVSAAQSASPRKDIPAIAKAANGAIVTIVMANNEKPIAQGTGFLVSADGVILTNYHVIETGNVAIVKFPDDTAFRVDGVLAADRVHDLAIIKVHGKTFPTLTLGNSDRVQVGEEVVAIGNPLGLELTVSNGILSGIRTVEKEGGRFLQVTAPISHGSSGGPLFNMAGEVIGITTLFLKGGENLNFAIPVNDAKRLLRNQTAKLQKLPNEQPSDSTTTTQGTGEQDGDDLKETLSWMQSSLDAITEGGTVSFDSEVNLTTLVEFSDCRVHFRHDIKKVEAKAPSADGHVPIRTLYGSEIVFNLGDIDPERISAEPYNVPGYDAYRVFGAYARNNEKKIAFSAGDPGPSLAFPLYADYATRFTKAFKHAVALCGGKPSKF
jgi:hypothetical protein